MKELLINLHMHTPYSDGYGSHGEIAQAALQAGLDAVIVTDHNVLVHGPQGYYQDGDRRVLMLIGEEVHDQIREPQKNHLLILGAEQEMATLAGDTRRLLESVQQAEGLAFFAHPLDPEAPAFDQSDLSWVDWDLDGYTGIELWNAMSEFKSLLKSKLHALWFAFNPKRVARGPFPEILARWDQLLSEGRRVVAIGGTDAHALPVSLGPLKRIIFPYPFHFSTVNTHALTPRPLSGDLAADRGLILNALRQGHVFIGYDLPAPTRGFRFTAHDKDGVHLMGEEVSARSGVTLQIRLPQRTECILLKDGQPVKTWTNRDTCTHITNEIGVYRVEVYIHYLGKRRGWIFSNPIYVRE